MRRKGLPALLVSACLLLLLVTLPVAIACARPSPQPSPSPAAPAPKVAPSPTVAPAPKPAPAPTAAAPKPAPSPAAKPAAKPTAIKVASFSGPTHPSRIMVEKSTKLLPERSGGRITVDYYPAEQLFTSLQALDSISKSIAQIGMIAAGYHPDRLKIAADVQWLPFTYDNTKFRDSWRAPGGLYDFVDPYYKAAGVKLLMWPNTTYAQVFSAKRIRTVDDLKGKMTFAPAGTGVELAKLYGISPVSIPSSEVYTALQRGTIEAVFGLSETTVLSQRIHEVAPYVTVADLWPGGLNVVANLQWFNSLPADLQTMIVNTFLELEKEHYAGLAEMIKKDRADLAAKPRVEIYVLPKEERARWIAGAKPLFDGLVKKYPDAWPKFLQATEKLR